MAPASPSEGTISRALHARPEDKQDDEQRNNGTPFSQTASHSASSSRSSSPLLEASHPSCTQPLLPEPVSLFFSSVSSEGFPEPEEKAQPWKAVWNGPKAPSKDGKLIVACPKKCVYGSNSLGGY